MAHPDPMANEEMAKAIIGLAVLVVGLLLVWLMATKDRREIRAQAKRDAAALIFRNRKRRK